MNTATDTTPVKVSWRKQEWLFITIIAVVNCYKYLLEAFAPGKKELRENFEQAHIQHGYTFNYNLNILLPQLTLLGLLYGSYLLLNRSISRFSIRKNKTRGIIPAHVWTELLFLLINAVLALAVAALTDLAFALHAPSID